MCENFYIFAYYFDKLNYEEAFVTFGIIYAGSHFGMEPGRLQDDAGGRAFMENLDGDPNLGSRHNL